MAGKAGNWGKTKPALTNTQYNTRSIKDLMSTQEKSENTSMLQEILGKITTLASDIAEMKNELRDMNATIRSVVKDEISKKESEWQEERNAMVKRLESIEYRDEMRLRREKKNNIIIRGLQSVTDDDCRGAVTNLLLEKLKLQVNVLESSLIKTTKGHTLIWAKIGDFESKRTIMSNKKNLHGTDIFIANDRTPNERRIQRELHKIADDEKKNGKEVKLSYHKIIIDGVTKIWRYGIGLTSLNMSPHGTETSHNNSHQDGSPFRHS